MYSAPRRFKMILLRALRASVELAMIGIFWWCSYRSRSDIGKRH